MKWNGVTFFLILMGAAFMTSAQDLNALVYFKDKANVSAFIANPASMLSQRSLARKERHGISIDERDVPVNQQYINTLKSQPGIDYRTQSKWFNAAHVVGSFEDVEALKNLDFVRDVVYADRTKSASIREGNKFDEEIMLPANHGSASNQIEMIGLDGLHNEGYSGSDVWIALTDSGFPNVDVNRAFATARSENRILGGYDFVAGDDTIYEDNFHGAYVFSIIAGQIQDRNEQYIGTAPDASYYLFRTEDVASETPVEMSYWVAAAERADSLGVDVMNVSLGYLGFDNTNENLTYQDMNGSSFISQGATTAVEKGVLVVTSAGNFGRSSTHPWIAAPADAPGVFAIGSVTASANKSNFSSIGPTVDGRIRPSVAAQGSATALIDENGQIRTGNGTSFSGPLIAGAMACLVQAFPDLSTTQLIDAVQQSGTQAANPDNQLGYGIPDFEKTFQTLSGQEVSTPEEFNFFVRDNILFLNNAPGENGTPFQLFNLQGQLLLDQMGLQENRVDLTAFSTGIYLFRITESGEAFKIVLR